MADGENSVAPTVPAPEATGVHVRPPRRPQVGPAAPSAGAAPEPEDAELEGARRLLGLLRAGIRDLEALMGVAHRKAAELEAVFRELESKG